MIIALLTNVCSALAYISMILALSFLISLIIGNALALANAMDQKLMDKYAKRYPYDNPLDYDL
jgi:hypothetical protein